MARSAIKPSRCRRRTGPIDEFGASEVSVAPDKPAPLSRFEAVFRNYEFDRQQRQMRV
jgi:hypothetical protein